MEKQPYARFVLAVDPALSMGVAVGEVGQGLIASGVLDMHETYRRCQSIGRTAKIAAMRLREWALQALEGRTNYVDLLAYEMPTQHGRNKNPLPQWAMVTAAHIAADSLRCWRSQAYWPSAVKARGAGHGQAGKAECIAAAGDWTGETYASHDQADAVLVLKVALEDLRRPAETQPDLF